MINIHTDILDQLTGDELSVFCQILRHINNDNKCFPSRHRLSELTGYGRDKISIVIKSLESKGIIKTTQSKENGKFSKTIYTILTDKAGVYITAKGVSLEENHRDTGFRTTEKPHTGNPTLSINHTLSINQFNIYTQNDFLENWKRCREKFLKKPTHIKKLNTMEFASFEKAKKDFTKEEINTALLGLFKQQNKSIGAMFLRPKHFLENIDKYLTAELSGEHNIYGDDKNKKNKSGGL